MKILQFNILLKLPESFEGSDYQALQEFIKIYENTPEKLLVKENSHVEDILINKNLSGSVDVKITNYSKEQVESKISYYEFMRKS